MTAPILLLHNTLTSSRLYDGVVQRIGEGRRVFALDFRAHGRRMHDFGAVNAFNLTTDVLSFADEAKLDRFVIGGSSIGATVALLAAERAPERVERLVLTGVNAEAARAADRLKYTAVAEITGRTGPSSLFLRQTIPLLFGRTFAASDPRTVGEWRRHIAGYEPPALAAALRCWRDRPDVLARARHLRVPTMVLAGDEDRSCPRIHAQRLCDVMPSATLSIVDRAGHMLPLERPDRFVAALVGD